VREIVVGMAHRGPPQCCSANILRKPYQELFAEFEDNYLPGSVDGDGDVKLPPRLLQRADGPQGGKPIHLSLDAQP